MRYLNLIKSLVDDIYLKKIRKKTQKFLEVFKYLLNVMAIIIIKSSMFNKEI